MAAMTDNDTAPMIGIDPAHISTQERYKLMIGSIVPRPIAWVSTLSPKGVPNLAPFSFFNAVCSEPPIISVSIMRRGSDGQKKDTLNNIEATGEFVVQIVSEPLVQAMNQTAAEYPPNISEFEAAGLTPLPAVRVKPYRVAEALIHLECKLHQIVTLGEHVGGGSLVLGRIVYTHFSPDVYHEGRIDSARLQPVARLAGNGYVRVTDTFELPRP